MDANETRSRREALLLTQTQLAALAGISDETLRKIEQGKVVRPSNVKRVMDALVEQEMTTNVRTEKPTIRQVVDGVVVEVDRPDLLDAWTELRRWLATGVEILDRVERVTNGDRTDDKPPRH